MIKKRKKAKNQTLKMLKKLKKLKKKKQKQTIIMGLENQNLLLKNDNQSRHTRTYDEIQRTG